MHVAPSAQDVLMGGGTGHPAWKFEDPGTTRTGIITSPPVARQEREYDKNNPGGGELKFFPSGDPIWGVVVELQGDEVTDAEDDGIRTFYVEGRYIKQAVKEAVAAAGAGGLEVGGRLTVTFTHREDPMDKRSRKYWNVVYVTPANAALMAPPVAAQAPAYAPPVAQAPQAPAYQPQTQWQAPPQAPAPTFAQPAPAPVGDPAAAAAIANMDPTAAANLAAWLAAQQAGAK